MINFNLKFIILIVIFLASCNYKQGVVEYERISFIKFTGELSDVKVAIDSVFFKISNDENILYEISPGKHTVTVKRNGFIKVHRNLLFGSGIIKEIRIP